MNIVKIFYRRLVDEWKFQRNVFKSVFDWTVIVYIVLPALLIFSFVYRSWWGETPDWVQIFPVGIIFLVLYLLSWIGQIRTYVLEADQMFLLKHRASFLRLKIYGVSYSILSQAVMLAVVVLVMLPFLLEHFLLSKKDIGLLFLFFFSLKLFIMALKIKIKKINRRFVQKIMTFVLFLVLAIVVGFINPLWSGQQAILLLLISLGFISAAYVLAAPYIKNPSEFEKHVMLETMERMKYIHLIFNFSYEVEKTNVVTRKRPLLFRKSQRFFKKRTPKRGFLELFMKIFIRNPLHRTGFLQMVAVSAGAIIYLPPLWFKILIFIGTLFMLRVWSRLVWEKIILSHPLMKKYNEHDSYSSAKRLATNVLVVIGGVVLSVAFLLSNIINRFFDQFFM